MQVETAVILGLFDQPVDGALPATILALPDTLDTSAPEVVLVNSTNPNGRYRVGNMLDIHVVFTKRVTLVPVNPKAVDTPKLPRLALFTPPHPGSFAEYASGNTTTTLHFTFKVPPADNGQAFTPLLKFDYAGVDSLFSHLRGYRVMSGAGAGEVEALIQLPPEGASYLRNARHIDISFEDVRVMSVASVTPDGVYTLGDVVEIQVLFDDAVVVFEPPPVLKLDLENRVADALYQSGNGTNSLLFRYTVEVGDESVHLEYLDTRPLLPHHPHSFALSFDQSTDASETAVSPSPLDRYSGGVFRAAAPEVPVVVYLPQVQTPGSLASNSRLTISTRAPVVTAVVSEQPSYVYREGFELGVQIYFSEPVVVQGCPRLKLRSNLRSQYAVFKPTPGMPENVIRLAYTVAKGADVAVLDYEDENALDVVPCAQWQTEAFVRRKAARPLLDADLRLPRVGPRETVLSPASISGDGLCIQLTPSTVAVQQMVDASDLAEHGPGSVINIDVQFTAPIISSEDSWLALDTGSTKKNECRAWRQWNIAPGPILRYAAVPLPFCCDGQVQLRDM
jgi:hypothetical protein